ncbi:MAG: nucleotide exchange factor GrpE [Clostridia bacterium]|nr:nucleotide exchange factor GrpE [Clostridia bacterium]
MAKKEEKKNTKKQAAAEPEEVKEEAAAEETAAAEESTDVEAKLCEQLKKKDEQYLRLAAEYDNYRKRTAKEKEDTFVNAKVSVLESFLEVADNFERAKDATGELEDYKKGIELIFTQFLEKLKALGAEPFGEAGESFDPELHMAVMHVEDDDMGEGEIVEVFQKGYKLGDKVIRHAAVKVAN